MQELKEVVVDTKRNKVTLKFVDYDRYGWVKKRQQITLRKGVFEAALRRADIIVPWDGV